MLFEKAAKLKLRFTTIRGQITTEDLFDMPLTGEFSLNSLAQDLNRKVKASAEESFVVKKNKADVVLELKFEIVKRVIEVGLDAVDKAKNAASNKIQKENILGIIADKENEDLKGESITKLKKMVKKLS